VQHPDRYSEVLIESAGAPVALSIWEPAPRAGAAPAGTVVFLPGTAVHPLFYEEFLDGLSVAGWPVVGVHPEGHGKSPRVHRTLRFPSLVRNAHDALAWAASHRRGPLVMVGSSQGALVALLAAADADAHVGGGVVGVLAHNVFDPGGVEGARITRLRRLARLHRGMQLALGLAASLAPNTAVPIAAYLDPGRVFTAAWTRELFALDPLCLPSYPVRFLADLITVDTSALYDGRLRVPVTVLTARRDPLFPLADTRATLDRIRAPGKRLVVLDVACHLVLNESLDVALPAVLTALDRLTAHAEETPGD
jgi:alpha-beta hydrolase superfamily lysophospholipase